MCVCRAGIIPLDNTSDIAGPLARTVEDVARMLEVLVAVDPNDPLTSLSKFLGSRPANYTSALSRDALKVIPLIPVSDARAFSAEGLVLFSHSMCKLKEMEPAYSPEERGLGNCALTFGAGLQGARIGVMRQVINTNTSDPGIMQLFETALTTLQQQGDPLNLHWATNTDSVQGVSAKLEYSLVSRPVWSKVWP